MSEIVCPSCEAKYRVPDSAIGPEGRRVHCSKCGEIWLARVPGVGAPAHETGPQRALPGEAPAPETGARAAQPHPFGEAAPEAAAPAGTGAPEPEPAPELAPERAPEPAFARATFPETAPAPEPAHGEAPEAAAGAEREPEPEQAPEPRPSRLFATASANASTDGTPAAEAAEAAKEEKSEPTWRRILAAEQAGGQHAEPDTARHETATAPPADGGGAIGDAGLTDGAPGAQSERDAQMAEIRRMLDELQGPRSGAGAVAAATAAAQPAAPGLSGYTPAGTPPPPQQKAAPRKPAPPPVEEDSYHDPLREKLLKHDNKAKASAQGNYDASRLAKRHARRHRRRLVAEEQRNSSGAFGTGLTLTAMVAGTMMLIYAFSAEIVARVPGSGPAMDEYVAVIDSWRAMASEEYAKVREKIDKAIEDAL